MEGPSVAGETVCARCGRTSSAEASFCASCGARLFGRLAVARAETALRAEAPEVAAEWAAKALEITARTRLRKYEAMARTYLGSALVAAGRRKEGLAELRSAVAIADSLVNPAGRWRPRAAAADALRSAGAEEEAVSVMLQARTIVMDFAATLAPGRGENAARGARGPRGSRHAVLIRCQREPSALAMRPAACPSP